MPFISENELEKALVRAVKNPDAAPDFYRLLLESSLLVMGTAQGQEYASEEFSLSPGGKLNLVTAVKNGAPYLPIFSSQPRMQEFVDKQTKYLTIKGRDLLDITRGAVVILNPASEFGKELSAAEVLRLLDGPGGDVPHYNLEEAYPAALVDALTAVFETRPEVIAAWMVKVGIGGAGDRHPLVGIDVDPGSDAWPSLISAIEEAAQEKVPGMVFDLHRMDRDNPAVGLTGALLKANPFYARPVAASSLN